MLKYHVAVCDDEKSDLDGIVQSVQQYDVQGCFDIETYMDGNELLSELQMQKKSFDLLLLDIEMPSNGFQLAQSLIQMEKHPLVVFVTKRHEYAVQGYGIAFRYLVKPLDQTLFAAAMDAVLQELNSKHLTIEYDGVTMSLETSDIYFLESHTEKMELQCTAKLLHLSLSTLIRRALHNAKIERTVVVVGGGEETLTAVSTLLAQCSKVGGNLNQLARHFNSGGADTEQLRAKLLDELADLTAFRLHAEKVLGELYGNAQAYRL